MGVSESLTKLGTVGCVLALDLSRAESEAKGWVCTHTVYLGGWRPNGMRGGKPVQGHIVGLGAGNWTWLFWEPKGVL